MSKLQSVATAFMNEIKVVAIVLCILSLSQAVSAQDEKVVAVNDPLNRPEVWRALQVDPYNDLLWGKYFEEDLFVLSKEQYLNYNKWKAYLVSLKQSEIEQREFELMRKREEYFEKRYSHKEKKSELEHLTQNIQKNFAVIEQYFEEQFDLLGDIYEPYYSKHKDQKYSKIKWVEEHEALLRELQEDM